jgi:Flp pilus assembly pilin Flp
LLDCAKIWLELTYDRRAVTALEYGLIAGVIFFACAGIFFELGANLLGALTNVRGLFPDGG